MRLYAFFICCFFLYFTWFFCFGRLPLILAGGITSSFMVRQRLGEFQYGYSYEENSQIALTGLTANLLLATVFALFKLFFPETSFFSIGIKMNLIMALCFMLPFPQLEGLQIYFGSRFLYLLGWIIFILTSLLILSGTKIGLIIIIILASIIGIVKNLWRA